MVGGSSPMNNDHFRFDDLTIAPEMDDTEDFKDVVLCKILYTEEFKIVFSHLKALMKADELSQRALYAACKAIALVPAHYTVWEYKYRIVEKLVKSNEYTIEEELEWCSETAITNEKNYQIWHYRGRIIDLLIQVKYNGDKTSYNLHEEYGIISVMLDRDEKNYHVWSYKRWLVQHFQLFRDEIEIKYTADMIDKDVRNNSAWNFRHFVIFGDKKFTNENIINEIDYAISKIEEAITNPSSWNYMKFLFSEGTLGEINNRIKPVVLKYSEFIGEEYLDQNSNRVSVPAFELLSQIYHQEGAFAKEKAVYTLLANQLDCVRANYWIYRSSMCNI